MESQVAGLVRDTEGDPIAGAVVSDGLSTCTSGQDGSFELPGWGPFVWVCPPPRWTSKRWWQPRGDSSHDFVLERAATPAQARIAHVTDVHLTLVPPDRSRKMAEPAPAAIDGLALSPLAGAIRNSGAGLVVVTGDVTDRGTAGELKAALRAFRKIGVPFRMLPGNHDHYGHQDDPQDSDRSVEDHELGTATFTRWEEVVGPRWWSMNFGGLHLVAMDWFSARTGADHGAQMRWLAADLSLLPPGYPVVLATHDHADGALLQRITREAPSTRLVATLCGHWHAPRAVKLDGALHLSTGPAVMVGRDWSPPQMRIVTWDGAKIGSETILPAGSAPPRLRSRPARWQFENQLGPAHSLHLAEHPDGIVATTADHDAATATVALIDGRTGKTRWSWTCPQPVSSAAAVDPEGPVYLQTAAGMVVRLDDAKPTWMIESPDPVANRVATSPILTGDGGLLTEGPGFIRCLKCYDGRVRWTRFVGRADVHYQHAGGRMCDGLAVLPLAGHAHGLTVLRPHDGNVVWGDAPGDPHPKSAPAPLGDGTAVIVREGTAAERFELETGGVRWRTVLDGPASGAAPVIIDELALVVTADAAIHILDSRTGWLLRVHRLPQTAGASPSRASSPVVACSAAGVGGMLHVITVAGEWWRLDPYHWEPEMLASLPVAVTAPPVEWGLNLVVPGREGILLAASLQTAPASALSLPGLPATEATGGDRKGRTADRWRRSIKLPRL